MTRYIFLTGGVVSSLGKGLASAVLAALLQARGFTVKLRKIDPYLNIDPGTMNPYEHGEVFVTDDGAETDMDLGHYERFTDLAMTRHDNITSGQIYLDVLQAERRGEYLGQTVQVIPHITDKIKKFICHQIRQEDFVIYEVGGTVGDIESLSSFEALRQFGNELGEERCLFIHVTLVPIIKTTEEFKTKPTQHSTRELQGMGIRPRLILCRSERIIPEGIKSKIALFCNIRPENVISTPDVESIYTAPLIYHQQGLDAQVLKNFGLKSPEADLTTWRTISDQFDSVSQEATVGIVGKYVQNRDCYKSLVEALIHAGLANNATVALRWYEASDLEQNLDPSLETLNAILIPGGFGQRGSEGMIRAAQTARCLKIPYLGICFGMQMAVIEIARHVAGLTQANSTEFGPTPEPVISTMEEWVENNQIKTRQDHKGGTMRLGAFNTVLKEDSLVARIYGNTLIRERHRHRYEVNVKMVEILERAGLIISGFSTEDHLPEVIEWSDHPWFIGVQYHPELTSRPFAPHPLFTDFIRAALFHG